MAKFGPRKLLNQMSQFRKRTGLAVYAMIFLANRTVAGAASFSAMPPANPLALEEWQSNRFGFFIQNDPVCLKGQDISWSRAGERRDRGEKIKEGIPAAEYNTLYQHSVALL